MDSAFWSAASGMIARQRDVEVTANNLANATVNGFRPESIFYAVWRRAGADVGARERAANADVQVPWTYTSDRPGTIVPTGAPLDVAVEGDAWLAVGTPRGERYTRGGSLRLGSDGSLLTAAGFPVLGGGGPIRVTGSKVEIDGAGRVIVDGAEAGALKLVRVPGADLAKEGDGLSALRPGAKAAPAGPDVTVRQGALEQSSVQPVEELIRLITAQRAFEQHAKTVNLIVNEIDRKAVNDIAQP